MRNSHLLTLIILVSLALFVFVAPDAVNKGVDVFNKTTGLKVGHLSDGGFRLGLDLLGGTHLVYQADLSQLNGQSAGEAMDGIRDVIERRVNAFGVAEPVVQISGSDRVIVELAGISDVRQAIALIGETPFLEFREETAETQTIIQAQQQGQRLDEQPFAATGLNGKHLERAVVVFDPQTGQAQVSLKLTSEGGELFASITRRNVGRLIAIYLDGSPISIPVVQTEISSGEAVITGRFTPQEARLLATRLNSGALPVPIKLVSQQTVGATLGAESLNASLKAGLYGLLFLALFMIAFYRLPGLISIAALLVYTLIVLTLYKVIPVTLTLAGVAGFILTLGMAVDANVLIFARMREELALGKPLRTALLEGFRRSWPSIRDSHVTTFISAFVLYAFTTSVVRGFALTLGLGAVASLFTSIVVTRSFLRAIVDSSLGRYTRLFA